MNRLIKSMLIICIIILLNLAVVNISNAVDTKDTNKILYSSYIKGNGWEKDFSIKNEETSGTVGKSKPIEAVKIKVENMPKGTNIKYQVHSADVGWQSWVKNGTNAGTIGKQIEAIKIVLENAEDYSVEYRAHVANIGWQGWVKDGELAGTTGQALRVEAIQIRVVQKNEKDKNTIKVNYQSHISFIGWQEWVLGEKTSGTTKKGYQMEALKIELQGNLPKNGEIQYQTHVAFTGWQSWKKNGELAGTTGQSKRIEAIRIKLKNMDNYSVEYRVYVANIGWQEWVIDGEMAGTTGESLPIEAIQIRVIPKTIHAKMYVDTDFSNVIDENEFNVKGWAMSNANDTNVQAYIDDKKVEGTVKYHEREDVIEQIKGYGGIENNAKPGFDIKINSTDFSKGEHRIVLKLEDKNGKKLTSVSKTFKVDKATIGVKYQTYITEKNWNEWVRGSNESNKGDNKIGAIKIKLVGTELPKGAKIKYRAHVSNIGWQDYVENGAVAGVTNKENQLEAIRIRLEGVDDKYSIEYNAYVEGIGWQGWALDGETAGTTGQSKKITMIKIRIVKKVNEVRINACIDEPRGNVEQKGGVIKGWVMTNQKDTSIKVKIDGKDVNTKINRVVRQDVIDLIKGFGGGSNNPKPGYTVSVDWSKYSLGKHKVDVQVFSKDGKVLIERNVEFELVEKFGFEQGTYGKTGLAVKGDSRGSNLPYYKIGNGPNVMFAVFAIHGWEDKWAGDGSALIKIAEDFKNSLLRDKPVDINKNWTIYVFPGVNRDGVYYGTSHNGDGRKTLYSSAPNNKGIDMNRCWQTSSKYKKYTSERNYNGTAPYQAYEANYLREFLLSHKATKGQTILVDLHGWLEETMGDFEIGEYYRTQYGTSKHIKTYGEGYLINWARQNLGVNGVTARSALVELPSVNNQATVDALDFSGKYYRATLEMLRGVQ